jgi:N-acetylmuramoyl-L-alanine amidase
VEFTPEGLPPNTVSMLVPFWKNRAVQTPRLQLVHTNGASGVATNQSSYNWATAKPESNTLPHYQVQLDGRAAKYIPTDRRGLDNATVTPGSAAWSTLTQAQRDDINRYGQVRNWSIGIETSDLGYGVGKPGDLSGFTDAQIETIAGILAYDSIVWDIPLGYPETWHSPGTACHTEPFEYPFWTLFRGKSCPGSKKKELMRTRVIPRANEIKAAWTGQEDDDVTEQDKEDIANLVIAKLNTPAVHAVLGNIVWSRMLSPSADQEAGGWVPATAEQVTYTTRVEIAKRNG